jgi:hypothetical protein
MRNLCNLYIQNLILETTSKVFEKIFICTRLKANQSIYNKLIRADIPKLVEGDVFDTLSA